MFVYRLIEPVDEFDGLTPLSDWLHVASPRAIRWALQAILALADAAPAVGWRGDMRHLPAVGVMLTPPATTPYLLVKQDDNGATFVVTAAEAAWVAADAAACTRVAPREIGAWIHPTREDIPLTATTRIPWHTQARLPPKHGSDQPSNRRSATECRRTGWSAQPHTRDMHSGTGRLRSRWRLLQTARRAGATVAMPTASAQ